MPRKILTDRGCFQRAPLFVDGLGYILPKKCRPEDYFVIRLNELDGAHILAMKRKVGRFQLNQSVDIAACLKTRSYREWLQIDTVTFSTASTSTGAVSSHSPPLSSSFILAASSTITLTATSGEIASPHDLSDSISSSSAASSNAPVSYQGVSHVPTEMSASLEHLYRNYDYLHERINNIEGLINNLRNERNTLEDKQDIMMQEFDKWRKIQRLIKRIPQASEGDRKDAESTVMQKIDKLKSFGLTEDEKRSLIERLRRAMIKVIQSSIKRIPQVSEGDRKEAESKMIQMIDGLISLGLTEDEERSLRERLNRAMAKIIQSSISSTIPLVSSSSSSSKEERPSHVKYIDVEAEVVKRPTFQVLETQHRDLESRVLSLENQRHELMREVSELKEMLRKQQRPN